ncbi:MAG: hypothetical protein JW941_06730 [Candidatus Coatesbacteria bacterium]|nr:hypothetical protein [Candidatus Coatesbacteria bacterium]
MDRCLSSLEGVADEIVVVDTGSVDDTKEVAAEYTDKIYDFDTSMGQKGKEGKKVKRGQACATPSGPCFPFAVPVP